MYGRLNDDITKVKGIGVETAKKLKGLQITTVNDLLEHFPFRYEDNQLRSLANVTNGERITVEGVIQGEANVSYYGRRRSRLTVRILVENVLIQAVFFNQPYLKNKFTVNERIIVSGKWDAYRQTITVQEFQLGERRTLANFEPVYSSTEKVTIRMLRRYIKQAFDQYSTYIVDFIPKQLREKYRLYNRFEALRACHFPESAEDVKQARRYFIYEEFLLFQLKMQALRKREREETVGIRHLYDEARLENFINQLPFTLTKAQQRVTKEILKDLKSPHRMNRLLQGDVGSGKTVVASICLYASIIANFQGALMVPTEILAEQHYESLKKLMEPFGVKIKLLTSSVKGRERTEILSKIKDGAIDILVGTHALIQAEVVFKNLGLVITDEQHRFGVEQRRALRNKGERADVLFMTATPIPRTLAITVFGEMDVSIIDELPAGRKKIETYWVKHNMLERVLSFIEKQLNKGHQAYVICPLIEESDKLDVQNALDVYTALSNYYKNRHTVGLMHGRLHPDEKDQVMERFINNNINILVSTTVVEVGVNVTNATVMLIYDAERFGLAQLHQLRGRVGRGSSQSYCILLADPKSEDGKERMKIMTETNDGFVLSERDLQLRGPGDFFGKKQSGLPEFKMADVAHDVGALETARQDAATLINSQIFWHGDEFKYLRLHLQQANLLTGQKLD